MICSYETLNSLNSVVFISSLLTLSAAVCDQLEKAGRSPKLCLFKGRFAVAVPKEMAADTQELLNGHGRKGEIFIAQD